MKRICFLYMLTFLLAITVSNGAADTIEKVFQNFKAAYEKSKNFSADFEETTLQAGNKSVARGTIDVQQAEPAAQGICQPERPDTASTAHCT